MTMSATPLQYPTINGARHSFASVEIRLAGLIIPGFKSITYSRTRNRAMVYGANSDPLGKTRGFNEYQGECEMYLAEFNYLQSRLQAVAQGQSGPPGAGPKNGYGDTFFNVYVSYNEAGFDLVQDTLVNCSLDTTDANPTQNPDALVRKFKLNPTKILFNGLDDSGVPLIAPPTT